MLKISLNLIPKCGAMQSASTRTSVAGGPNGPEGKRAQNMFFRTPGITKTYPTLKTSANFRNAELMRIGKGYFWKSLGKRTTASHCSPSLPDLRPSEKAQEELITNLRLQAETANTDLHKRSASVTPIQTENGRLGKTACASNQRSGGRGRRTAA